MMQKLVYVSADECKLPKAIKDTHSNELPTPFREISSDEFWHKYGNYTPHYQEYRQVHNIPDNKFKFAPVTIYWYSDGGLAVAHPVEWESGKEYFIHYKDQPRYFAIGCKHELKELSKEECHKRNITHHGMCWHVYECKICNYIESHDSSD